MQSVAAPLDRLDESTAWFWHAPEIRVLRVRTTATLRLAALHVIAAYEHRPANRRPVVVLEAPHEQADGGWDLRAAELVDDQEALCEAAKGAGAPLPAPEPVGGGAEPLVRFAGQLARLVEAVVSASLEGVVVVLAPVWVEAPERWATEVRQLVQSPAFARVRWVLVDVDADWTASAVGGLGALVETCEVTVDPRDLARETDDIAQSVAAESADAALPAIPGGAVPRVVPPPRKSAAPSQPSAEQMGVSKPKVARKLRALLAELSIAARRLDWVAASAKLREARDLCDVEGEAATAARLTVDLGTLALSGQARPAFARELYADALRRAERLGAQAIAAQAEMAIAAAWQMERNVAEAVRAYEVAGERAETAGETVLAIHCFCTAGELLSNAGRDLDATRAWNRCLQLSGSTRLASRAPDAARALATVMRRYGQAAKAEALEQHAHALSVLELAPPKADRDPGAS